MKTLKGNVLGRAETPELCIRSRHMAYVYKKKVDKQIHLLAGRQDKNC